MKFWGILLGVVALLFAASRGFGARVAPVAPMQPAENSTLRNISSRVHGITEPVYAVTQEQSGAPGPTRALAARPGLWPGRAGGAGRHLYVGTRKGLFRSADDGVTWRRVFKAGILSGGVRAAAIPFVGAGKDLFVSVDGEKKWRRVFKAASAISSMAVDPKDQRRILVGTEQGLYESRGGGASWTRVDEGVSGGAIHAVLIHPHFAGVSYALTDAGLFRRVEGAKGWERIWVSFSRRGGEGESGEDGEIGEGEESGERSGALAVDAASGFLYRVMSGRIWVSQDGGFEWAPIEVDLPGGPIYAVAIQNSAWRQFEKGAPGPTRAKAARPGDRPGRVGGAGRHLLVGTAHGLFRIPLPAPPQSGLLPPGEKELSGGKEPTIQEVQKVAIRYAEVMPEKISNWRRLAVVRNFIPRMTVSLDRDRDQTIASSTSSGKTTFTVGPEDESVSLDFGFTWDLANLVWNPDQTSIDTRSRLMVQLRADVLEEVTRIYFERKRLLAEFGGNPTDDSILEQERALRIEELAAQIDALTGGWFSRRMRDEKWKENSKYENNT